MKHVYKRDTTMIEHAGTVFEDLCNGRFKAVKSRHGDLIIGGMYSRRFVEVYARENDDVYIVN